MKQLLLMFAMVFGFTSTLSAQQATNDSVGLNFHNMAGRSVEIVGMEEECRNPETGKGTCTVTVKYNKEDTLQFPMYFIQGRDTLERITSADSAIGWEAVQGVKFTLLPNGVPTYMLEIRNLYGGTYIQPVMPKL